MILDLNKKEHQVALEEVFRYCCLHRGLSVEDKVQQAIFGLKYAVACFPSEQATDEHHQEAHNFLHSI